MPFISYDEWTELLCSFFFETDNAGKPVTLFVDDELIDELAGGTGGIASLRSAVRVRLGSEADGQLFERIYTDSMRWKSLGAEGCPPSLPLLALSVLAAARMARATTGSGAAISASNYYRPFREMLGLRDSAGAPRGYDETIPPLWQQLKWWMDERNQGKLGTSTVEAHPTLVNIGFALSQALFRKSDRERLTEFFKAIDLEPGDELSSDEMLVYFRTWAPRSSLSPGAKIMAREGVYSNQLAGILLAAMRSWDGAVRDEAGRKLAGIKLVLTFRPAQLRLAAEKPPGFPDDLIVEGEGTGSVRLAGTSAGWYDFVPVEVSEAVLSRGLALRGQEFALTLRPEHIYVLRQDPVLGGPSSVREVDPLSEHRLILEQGLLAEVERFLGQHAEPGWSREELPGAVPAGWVLLRDVRVSRPPQATVKGALAVLVPNLQTRPRLWGGLGLPRLSGAYLVGGEPAVSVPPGEENDDDVQLRVDERHERVSRQAGLVALSGRGLLEGAHEVAVGPTMLRFSTVFSCGAVEGAGTGSVGHLVALPDGRPSAVTFQAGRLPAELPGSVRITGAAVLDAESSDPDPPRPVILRTGAEQYLVLGARPGQITMPVQPREPGWLKRAGLNFNCFEFSPGFPVCWILWKWRDGWAVRLSLPLVPDLSEPFEGSPADAVDWMGPFQRDEYLPGKDTPETDLWDQYRAAIEEWAAQ